jgi:hypothetical protein
LTHARQSWTSRTHGQTRRCPKGPILQRNLRGQRPHREPWAVDNQASFLLRRNRRPLVATSSRLIPMTRIMMRPAFAETPWAALSGMTRMWAMLDNIEPATMSTLPAQINSLSPRALPKSWGTNDDEAHRIASSWTRGRILHALSTSLSSLPALLRPANFNIL